MSYMIEALTTARQVIVTGMGETAPFVKIALTQIDEALAIASELARISTEDMKTKGYGQILLVPNSTSELEEKLAKLESECFEGYPTGTRGVFDYVAQLKQERDDLKKLSRQKPVGEVNDRYSRDGFNDEISTMLAVGTKLYALPPDEQTIIDALTAERDQLKAQLDQIHSVIQIAPDGNQIGVLCGIDLQTGICGFGDTVKLALDDFKASCISGAKAQSQLAALSRQEPVGEVIVMCGVRIVGWANGIPPDVGVKLYTAPQPVATVQPDNQIQSAPALRDAMFFIGKDGNEFYAVRDDFKNLHESKATFGKTPIEALCGLLNAPQPAKPLTEDFLTRLDRWLCRAKFETSYDVERCVEFGKEIHKMLAQVTDTKPTDDLLEVVRGLCCMVDQINAMPDNPRENYPSILANNSPLMIAARQACLDHGFTEGGLAISAEAVKP